MFGLHRKQVRPCWPWRGWRCCLKVTAPHLLPALGKVWHSHAFIILSGFKLLSWCKLSAMGFPSSFIYFLLPHPLCPRLTPEPGGRACPAVSWAQDAGPTPVHPEPGGPDCNSGIQCPSVMSPHRYTQLQPSINSSSCTSATLFVIMLQSSNLRQNKVTNEDVRLDLLDSSDLKLECRTVGLKYKYVH